MTNQTHRFAVLCAAALAAALVAAPAAQAFTFSRNAAGDSGANLNYADPMENLAGPSQGGSSQFSGQGNVYQQGGLTVQMHQFNGAGSFNQRYNANNLLDPFAREGR
jgi:hypothetical protein